MPRPPQLSGTMRQIPTEGCGSDAGREAWPWSGLTINSRRAEAGHVTAFALDGGCPRRGTEDPGKQEMDPCLFIGTPDEFEILAWGHMEWIFQEEIIHRSVSTQPLFTLSSGPFEADFSSPHILT